ncbi:DNA internalization-related competence protein ComEC/Rec2 [Stenotrophomonas maltophilia]|uniref:DNA internalization-related competence protein ComEC/Rec2 n=1 Tax=Stenotrophomonas maltophilia TaxID=40324 RepID=UPI0018D276EA|nr:DNA internalization-related competence protein ComEC/Rec2 [Stenotrophomonas maltophilia]MBH1385149.1 DNA internalization-related competence protein ComEC/Rec2 [Stenotrophomonas maltophilia]MBN5105746.1 DNA internalization-related competence protein ComEC/Rec2 [Stenotrophomonas maltophilia]MCM2520861.1 DNA internalization-related competence protein ComEC/Rec2 [Stenotrophomonas maltophilia]HDX0839733.1 DNA internalization-related competence protein ComEC/Rec2 [Stenotrophomonas maltophilia]HDX
MVPDRSAPALFGFGCAAGLVLGALACVQMPMLLPLWLSVLMAIAGAGGWLLPWRGRAWAAALLGLAWATVHGHWVLHGQLPPGAPPQDVQVRGRVADLPQQGPGYTRFVLHVEDAGALPSLRGKRLQVTWNDPWRGSPAHEAEGERHAVRAGSHWQLSLRVRAPRSRINPGGFDGERHAVLRGISGNASVRDPARAREWLPAQGLQAWRERSSAAIAVQVAHPAARFVQALALGDTRGLSDADWEHLRALGLTHLVAISGFHVGVVAGFGVLLCRLWWWLCPLLGRYWPRPQAAAWGAALAAATYAVAAGGALPTVRAALMIGLVALARAGRRPVGAGQGLALAAMVMLLPAPLSVLSAGFWLSFGGVLWLLWCLPRTGPEGIGGGLRGFLAAQGVASLGLLPLCIALFGGTARLGPLVNLPIIPWWTMLVVPLSLLGTGLHVLHDGAGRWAWRAAAWLFELSWGALQPLALHPQAMWWLAEAPRWALPVALLGVFWWLLPRGAGGGLAGLLLCLPLLWPARHAPAAGELELLVHDVGQGTAVLVRTARHALWYDVGPPTGGEGNERILVPALRALGQGPPRQVMLSHDHLDHTGSLPSLRRQLPGLQLLAPPGSTIGGATPCQQGMRWKWDGVDFQVLHPAPGGRQAENEDSCVLRIASRHGVVLLPGDIGRPAEGALLQAYPHALRADVVLVPHHGSGGSSSAPWVAAVAPRLAVVSAGHRNRFGHPRQEVVQRWQAQGAEVLATADSGAIRVWLGAQGLQLREQRIHASRWWDAAGRARSAAILSPIEQAAVGPEG